MMRPPVGSCGSGYGACAEGASGKARGGTSQPNGIGARRSDPQPACLAAAVTSSRMPYSPRTATVGRSIAAATSERSDLRAKRALGARRLRKGRDTRRVRSHWPRGAAFEARGGSTGERSEHRSRSAAHGGTGQPGPVVAGMQRPSMRVTEREPEPVAHKLPSSAACVSPA